MLNNASTIFNVSICCISEYYYTVCDELPELIIVSKNYDTIINNIPESIKMLMKHNYKKDVIVEEIK